MEAKRKIIEFYGAPSPNVVKIHLMLRELGDVAYSYNEINIRRGEQYSPDFLKINPNGKLPAIVDHDVEGEPISVFESGNILYYLASKYDKLIPNMKTNPKSHNEVMNWIFWQMSNLGPVLGELIHFNIYAVEKHQYSIQRFGNELRRLLHVLNRNLEERKYVASNDEFTIADIATYPWARYIAILPDIQKEEFPHLYRWLALVKSRPTVAEWEAFEDEQRIKNNSNPPSPTKTPDQSLLDERSSLIQTQKSIQTPI